MLLLLTCPLCTADTAHQAILTPNTPRPRKVIRLLKPVQRLESVRGQVLSPLTVPLHAGYLSSEAGPVEGVLDAVPLPVTLVKYFSACEDEDRGGEGGS